MIELTSNRLAMMQLQRIKETAVPAVYPIIVDSRKMLLAKQHRVVEATSRSGDCLYDKHGHMLYEVENTIDIET